MPTIDLTDDELAAMTAAIRRVEEDRFPHAPRLDPLKAAIASSTRRKRQPLSPPKKRPQLEANTGRGD